MSRWLIRKRPGVYWAFPGCSICMLSLIHILSAIHWLEDFLYDFVGTVIVVSHDRHFLNNVCTHIVDIDYGKIKMYVGNYDFWYESSRLVQQKMCIRDSPGTVKVTISEV